VLGRGVSEDFLVAWWRRSNRPLWTAGFRVFSAVVGACVLRLLVVFVLRTSGTPVATWIWQTKGRSAERVILGVRPSEFILLEFQSPSIRIFIGSHSLPPPSGCLIGPSPCEVILDRIKLYKVCQKPWGLSVSPAIVIDPPAWCGAARTLCAEDVETPFLGGEAP
jgi:hypothetical protein